MAESNGTWTENPQNCIIKRKEYILACLMNVCGDKAVVEKTDEGFVIYFHDLHLIARMPYTAANHFEVELITDNPAKEELHDYHEHGYMKDLLHEDHLIDEVRRFVEVLS